MLATPGAGHAGATFLYATPHACASSGIFGRRQCEIAFTNAQTDVRSRTEAFSSLGRCEARYRLCEKGEDGAWRAALLGVEIVGGAHDRWAASPVLGLDTPRLFVNRPIDRLIEPMTEAWAPILPSGRFRLAGSVQTTASAEPMDALDREADAPATQTSAARITRESALARRERLRAAPFVE